MENYKKFLKKSLKFISTSKPLLKSDNIDNTLTDEKKSIIFAKHLSNTFKPHHDVLLNTAHSILIGESISSLFIAITHQTKFFQSKSLVLSKKSLQVKLLDMTSLQIKY